MIEEDWLQRINRIFTVIGLKDDAIRINAATLQFTGEAIHWWNVTIISNPIETMKLGKYFLKVVRNEKMSELLTLKQGDSIVTEFEIRFSSLRVSLQRS